MPPDPTWRKPSRCESGHCPEIKIYPNVVYLRNSFNPEYQIAFTADEWCLLAAAIRAGEFDLPEVTR